jgi:LPS-assembly protein
VRFADQRDRLQASGRIALLVLLVAALILPAPGRAEEPPKKVPVSVAADNLDYDRANDVYTAVGHVRIEQEGIRLEADRVVLNNRTGEALAEGHVFLRDKGDTLIADRVEINLNTRAGIIHRGELFMAKDNYHLKGERIERRSETVYHIEEGIFTTCDEDEWYLKAKRIDVDMDRYATGSGVSFNMAGLPVIYTPYLLFPVRRQTGLLIPEMGYGSTDGFLMKNTFFWAISDYQDITFTSDYRARAGHGTGIEYRYVNSQDSSGRAFYNYFDVRQSDEARWEFQFAHREEFAEDLSFRSDITLVSDEAYYRDLERDLIVRARPYVDSNAFYVERWNTASLYLLGQYSTDLTRPNDLTLQKLPELRYLIFGETIAPRTYFRFEGSAVNFSSDEGRTVLRADFRPELTAVLSGGGLSLTPRAGGRVTYYDRGATTIQPAERKYLYAGGDLTARFSRVYGEERDSGIGLMRHSIEPMVSYSYLPKIDENDTPHLDSVDEVKEENLVTFSLVNRLTGKYREGGTARTVDLMVFRLSMAYDVNEARRVDVTDPQPRSEVKGELYVKTPKLLSISATGSYNTYLDKMTSNSESVAIRTDLLQVDLSHQFLLDPRTRFWIGGLGTKLGSWGLSGQVWWDAQADQATQQTYKVQYSSQCWGLGLTYISTPGERNYLVMFELRGLGAMQF